MSAVTVNDPRFEYRSADLNGVTYNYIYAEPPAEKGKPVGTVFLIHGWPDLSLGWRNQISFLLSHGLRVIAPDMMGYGGTDAPDAIDYYSLKRAADDIAALAKYLGLSRIVLGGHDWGGAVVYRTVLWHPELISAFFVLSTPFSAPTLRYIDKGLAVPSLRYQLQFRTDAIQDYLTIEGSGAQNTTRIRQVLNTIYGKTLPNDVWAFNASAGGFEFDLLDGVTEDSSLLSKEELDFYVENYSEDPFNKTLNWYRAGELDWLHELALLPGNTSFTAKFSQPALYIGAPRDPALPLALSTGMETYFDQLSRGVVDTSPNASHWMMWDKPEEVNGHIGNWLTTSVLGNVTLGLNLTAGIGAGCGVALR
ncbi:epoxide hydrolase [Colletotrichum plurivorum]|uniref:Epoxide hydrolase n=1 Tax=Colletotrichum plurivorum TaxID=2175906 RepID=A0A8H6N8Z9_9PEZI|nr:epoxide hydrolase [Colletotrichum plurivorum]